MIIKVCGLREPDNIRAVSELDIDMIGFIFYPKSSRFVEMLSSRAGIIPDRLGEDTKSSILSGKVKRVGVFVDEMVQSVVTRIYNFQLDYVQLHGDEPLTYIDNLRATVVPDIRPELKVIKAISVACKEDLEKAKQYEGHVDMLLFDTKCDSVGGSGEKFNWDFINEYDGSLPFILSGGIGPDDVERVKAFAHPKCVGIDLNSKFETAPAVKDVNLLSDFVADIRN